MAESPETPAPRPPRAERSPTAPLEMLVKVLAASAALFYVMGFLTTNAYLFLLGVADFSLLRTRFILTGVLVFIPLVPALLGGIYAAVDMVVHRNERGLTRRAYTWILIDIALPFLFYFFLFAVMAENELVTSARLAALLSLVCSVLVMAILFTAAIYRTSGRRPLSYLMLRNKPESADEHFRHRFGVPDAAVEGLVLALVALVLFLTYLGLFGQFFYPLVPEQMGGGRPRTAQLLIAGDGIAAAQQLGLSVSEGDPLTDPVQLLWEGEDSYAVRLPAPNQRTVVQLARGLVAGVVTGAPLSTQGAP